MMSYARTFEGYAPPNRYDGLPFTSVQIRESATETGTYTTLETIALSPVDADPSAPATRNFTTALATLEDGWYIIRWVDAASSTFDSDPVRYLTSTDSTSEAEARAKLGRMTDYTTEPVLTTDDLDDLLSAAARPDADGLDRSDADWTPTWDLNAGAAEGWARKASKAAANFNFAEDGQRFDRAQIYAHCAAQQKVYADKAMGSLPLTT
jgi:hypothetical protein